MFALVRAVSVAHGLPVGFGDRHDDDQQTKGKTMTHTYDQIRTKLENREPFKGNSMSGYVLHKRHDLPHTTGRLVHLEAVRFWDDLDRATAAGLPFYVVYSYETPIAWAVGREPLWRVAQKFSRTTSRQQGRLYSADRYAETLATI